ncbi:hypothetical protein M2138_000386 [Dysgonomonadaceae bacterium PH5-43]|nr:hypothetical protein [Dysgonomonadaceae bacterium PH5-43]
MKRQLHIVYARLAMLAISLFVAANISAQTTITPNNGIVYVKPSGTGNGSSWANAANLVDALKEAEIASQIQEIRVAAGTYYAGAGGSNGWNTFYIPPGITIAGGYPGADENETPDPVTNKTILSGKDKDGGKSKAQHVLTVINTIEGSTTTIKGFHIQDGLASGGTSTITVEKHILNNNLGAGVYAYTEGAAHIVFEDNTIKDNLINITEKYDKPIEELNHETLYGEEVYEQMLIKGITKVSIMALEAALGTIGCAGPCATVVTFIPEKLIENGLGMLFSVDAVHAFLEDVYDSKLEIYTLAPSILVSGAGIYANGNIILKNNNITNNKINAQVHTKLKNDKSNLVRGAYAFMTSPIVYGAGAGIYATGDITLEGNTITGNYLKADSKAEIDPSFKFEGVLEKTMFISNPMAITYGGGVYASGTVRAYNNEINKNRIDGRIENHRNLSLQGAKLRTSFNLGGQAMSFGGGAYFSGDVALNKNNFNENTINPTSNDETGDLSFVYMSATSMAYGAGAMVEVNGERPPIIIENNNFNDNAFSKFKWNSSSSEKEIGIDGNGLKDVDGFLYAVNSGTGLAIENLYDLNKENETLDLASANAQISGNTFNGNNSKNTTDLKGGAIYLNNINANLTKNTISDNKVSVYNRVEYNTGGILGSVDLVKNMIIDIVPSYFRNKKAKEFIGANAEIKGGVIYNSNSLPNGTFTMNNCTISKNNFSNKTQSQLWEATARLQVDLYSSIYGGVYIKAPHVDVSNSRFTDNALTLNSAIDQRGHNFSYSKAMGAGIYIDHLDAEKAEHDAHYLSTNTSSVTGNRFENNTIDADVHIAGEGLVFNPSDDSNLEVDVYGAGLYQVQGGITLDRNQFSNNQLKLKASASGATHDGDNDVITKVYGAGAYLMNISGTNKIIQHNIFNGNNIDAEGNGDDWGTNSSDVVVQARGGGLNIDVVRGKAQFTGNNYSLNKIKVITMDDDTSKDTDANAFGGGLYLFTAKGIQVEMDNDVFSGNELYTETYDDDAKAYARSYGGGFYGRLGGSVVANRMEVRGNYIKANSNESTNDNEANANAFGAGIFVSRPDGGNGSFKLYNSLIAQNEAVARVQSSSGTSGGTHYTRANGGAIYFDDVKAELINLTIADNLLKTSPAKEEVPVFGKDVRVYKDGAGFYIEKSTVKTYNTIFYKNKREKEKPEDGYERVTIADDNAKTISIVNCLYDEEKMKKQAKSSIYGMAEFAGADNYRQKLSSLGVDKGEDLLPKQYSEFDLDGKARVLGTIDIGAYEISTMPDKYGIVYVKKGGTGDRSGRNWENACPEVAIALDEARLFGNSVIKGIWVAEGTYMPMFKAAETRFDEKDNTYTASTTEHHKSLVLADNVEVYGGFPENANSTIHAPQDSSEGEKIRALDTRDIPKYETILSGKLENGTAVYHVMIAPGTTGAILDGFTISGGEATASSSLQINVFNGSTQYNIPDDSGAGIYSHSADYVFRNLTIKNNAAHRGSGIYDYTTTGTATRIENCSFLDNETTDSGALDHNTGTLTVLNCEFKGNKTNQYGSAIYNRGTSTLNVVNTLVADNGRLSTSTVDCSAVHNFVTASTLNIINSTIANNEGYGIYRRESGTINVSNSIVWNNTKGSYSGTINTNYSLLEGGNTDNNCLNTDPRFVDTAEGDYSLRTISPACDAGSDNRYNTTSYGSLDIIGNTRFNGTIDMGAYEFTGIQPDVNGVLYIKKGGSGNRTGNSWANAYPFLAQAMYKAKVDPYATGIKEIWVAEGIYQPLIDVIDPENYSAQDYTFYLSPELEVYGGFSKDANDRDNAPNKYLTREQALSTRDWSNYETIMSGEYTPLKGDGSKVNVYHVVTGVDIEIENEENRNPTLDGFIILGGIANGPQSNEYDRGAGVYLKNSSIELKNLVIRGNKSTGRGAGIYYSPELSSDNKDKIGILILNNVLVENNVTEDSYPGVYSEGGFLRIIYSKFINNTTIIENPVVTGGEGIFYSVGTYNNKPLYYYASKYPKNAWFTTRQSSYPLDIINTLVAKNTRGIYADMGNGYDVSIAYILNTTIADNERSSINVSPDTGNKINVVNCIVRDGSSSEIDNLFANPILTTITYNILPDYITELSGEGNTQEDPIFVDAAQGDYSLAKNSPAINTGSSDKYNTAGSSVDKDWDLSGNDRFFGESIDKGAYEFQDQIAPDDLGIVYVWEGKTGKGTSWDDAYPNLYTPIKRAQNDKRIKEIWVAYGNYTTSDINSPMKLVQGVKVYGGFKGVESSIDERVFPISGEDINNPVSYTAENSSMIISDTSNGNTYVIEADDIYCNPLNEVANVVLDGFAFKAERRLISNTNADYTIRNAYFVENDTHHLISNTEGSDFVMENVLFKGNKITDPLIKNEKSTLSISQSLIRTTESNVGAGFGPIIIVKNTGTATEPASLFMQNSLIVKNDNVFAAENTALIWNNEYVDFTLINTTIANTHKDYPPIKGGNNGKIYNSIIVDYGGDASWVQAWDIQYSHIDKLDLSGNHKNKGNSNANPMLNADYSLNRLSYLINTGKNDLYKGDLISAIDVVGNSRLIDKTIDIGALENTMEFEPTPDGIVYVWEGKTGKGTSWEDAYPNLADALHKARTDSRIKQIWVATGTYRPEYQAYDSYNEDHSDRDVSFVIPNGLKLYGGFVGIESDIDQRFFYEASKTVLNGTLSANKQAHHVLIAAGLDNVTIDGFTVTGGLANGTTNYETNKTSVPSESGAGIFIKDVREVSLKNMNFYANESSTSGGANIYVENSSLFKLYNSRVHDSESIVKGAGLYAKESNVDIVNSLFYKFSMDAGIRIAKGAAINFEASNNNSCNLNIINSTITDCKPAQTGYDKLYPVLFINANSNSKVNIHNSIIDAYIGGPREVASNSNASLSLKNTAFKEITTTETQVPTLSAEIDNSYQNGFGTLKEDYHYPDLKNKGNNDLYSTSFGSLTEDLGLDYYPRWDDKTIDLGPFEEQNQIRPDDDGIIYVWEGKTGKGTSWEDAYPNLADPLLKAKTNKRIKQIWVAEGTYHPMHNPGVSSGNSYKSFVMVEGVDVYGGFAGTETSIDERVLGEYESVLSGLDENKTEVHHIMIAPNIPDEAKVVLDGFTFAGGKNTASSGGYSLDGVMIYNHKGVAIYNENATLEIKNITIKNNSAGGSLIYSKDSDMLLSNSIITNNTNSDKGIIDLNGGSLKAANVLIADNEAALIAYVEANSVAYLTNFTIANNTISNDKTVIIKLLPDITSCEIYNSIVYGNTIDLLKDDIVSGNCLIGVNPVFAAGTYIPGRTSPAIDMGNDSYYDDDIYGMLDLAGKERFQSAKIDMGAYESIYTPVLVWNGSAADNDWNNEKNWTPNAIPMEYTVVYIPGNVTHYPILKEDVLNVCYNIYFLFGSEVRRPDLLLYKNAYVQLNMGLGDPSSPQTTSDDYNEHLAFSAKNSAEPLDRQRWYMLSMPIEGVVTGDLIFGGHPNVFFRKFSTAEDADAGFMRGSWTNYFKTNAEPLAPGEGFVYWMNGYKGTPYYKESDSHSSMHYGVHKESDPNYGLKEVNGIIELPFVENEATSHAHRLHKYDKETYTSTFSRFYTDGDNLAMAFTQQDVVVRSPKVNRIITTSAVTSAVSFAEKDPIALVGNPYMSTIDFTALANANAYKIKGAYHIWTGKGFTTYTKEGVSGAIEETTKTTDQYIAPMQSFLVERAEENITTADITFTIADITPNDGNSTTLRSANQAKNKIELIARNQYGAVQTYIALREDGSEQFGRLDSRKILMGIGSMPEVYSLKESILGERVAIGGNHINSNQALVPLGLATSTAGEMSFTLKGMNACNAKVMLFDTETNTEIDITGMESFEYNFNYTPPIQNDVVGANNSRFYLNISKPNGDVNIDDVSESNVYVYSEKGNLYVVSSPSNPIHECSVYDVRGSILYIEKNIDSAHYQTQLHFQDEVVIVRVVTQKGVKNTKLLIQ